MNLANFSSIIGEGWPDDEKLDNLPFGEQLKTLGASEEHGAHIRKVVECMNDLLSKPPINALCDANTKASQDYVRLFLDVCGEIQGNNGIFSRWDIGQEHVTQFLRIAALYHDIGKFIQRDRHPTVGYYHVTLVEQQSKDHEDAENLEKMLGERLHRILCDMIRYHDLFGVVGTGEGSAPVLIDTLPFRSRSVEEQQTILSLLLFLNIADISGTIPLTSVKAGTLAGDWQRLSRILTESHGNREEFSKRLIASEQNANAAIERIRRLMLERAPDSLREGLDSPIHIEDILQVTLGTQFYEFCSDFALVCKFDYALRFITALENYAAEEGKTARQVIEVVTSLITRLVQSYSALTKRYDGSRRRIGIQVSGWSRTKEISMSLIKLLFNDLPRGLGWASEEATAWYFE